MLSLVNLQGRSIAPPGVIGPPARVNLVIPFLCLGRVNADACLIIGSMGRLVGIGREYY